MSPRLESAERYRRNPGRNGLFCLGLEICGLEGLGGGRDRDRTCDPLAVSNYHSLICEPGIPSALTQLKLAMTRFADYPRSNWRRWTARIEALLLFGTPDAPYAPDA